jgi:hypothetical protein
MSFDEPGQLNEFVGQKQSVLVTLHFLAGCIDRSPDGHIFQTNSFIVLTAAVA